MRFSELLREATKESWKLSLDHPFVQGIVSGDLPLETFKNYILQDIYYLKHYGKVHALRLHIQMIFMLLLSWQKKQRKQQKQS